MRASLLPLGTENYQDKMKVAEYLKAHGIADYWQVPIQEYIIKDIRKNYPDNLEEYIEKY